MTSRNNSTIQDIDSVLNDNNDSTENISNHVNEKENDDTIVSTNYSHIDPKRKYTHSDAPFTSKFNYNSYSKPFTISKHHPVQQFNTNNNINLNNNNNSINNNSNSSNSNEVILIEIDNLPPNKTWKQIKYLIGGIIHHSNVLQVKILPPMTSFLPPFITLQNCIITLQSTLSNDMINDLISTLNLYTWDNFDLYAYILPTTTSSSPFSYMNYPNIIPQQQQQQHVRNSSNSDTSANLPFPFPMISPMYIPQQQQFNQTSSPKKGYNDTPLTPNSISKSPSVKLDLENKNTLNNNNNNNKAKMVYPPPPFVPMLPTSPPPQQKQQQQQQQQQPTMIMSPPNGVAVPLPPIPTIPGMIPPPPNALPFTTPYFATKQQPRHHHPHPQSNYGNFIPSVSFKTRYGGSTTSSTSGSPPSIVTGYKRRYSHNQYKNPLDMSNEIKDNLQESYQERQFSPDLLTQDLLYYYPTQTRYNLLNKRNANPFKQPNKLKNIFNEVNFRKQMTERGMFQLKLDNFPPYLLPETETLMTNLKDEEIDIHTDSIEKFGKLRWTILKDFIKLKCPKLLNLRGQYNESIGNNTREFYVGVYEAEETKLIVDIKPGDDKFTQVDEEDFADDDDSFGSNKIVEMEAILYNAIIGFHNKELSDMCFENLRDQEYSLGYKLHVTVLSPYEDKETESPDVENNEQEEEEEERNIVQGVSNLSISNHTN
ncbi:hypothetical protein C6P44_003656 [Monosporozyma unispora]|nr:hypothetical protein C6P44_003656 [Kazachstania unispora]